MIFVICAVIGYLLGSINASIIISKFKGTDIRKHGSGNAGATNTLRTFGVGAALFAVLIDILKGVVAVLLVRYITNNNTVAELIAGFGAILGHNYPIYFGFKGGKGVLTSFAVALAVSPLTALIALAVAITIMAITRYVSLGSIIGAITLAVTSFFICDKFTFIFMIILAVIVVLRHYQNIQRLLNGTERKLGEKAKMI